MFTISGVAGSPIRITKFVSYHSSRGVPVEELADRCSRTLTRARQTGLEQLRSDQKQWLDESLQDIVKTLELEPRHFGALSGRGLIYVQKKDLPKALKAFEDALAVYPQMTGPRSNAEAIRQILQKEI